jgi:hypothetical protein
MTLLLVATMSGILPITQGRGAELVKTAADAAVPSPQILYRRHRLRLMMRRRPYLRVYKLRSRQR